MKWNGCERSDGASVIAPAAISVGVHSLMLDAAVGTVIGGRISAFLGTVNPVPDGDRYTFTIDYLTRGVQAISALSPQFIGNVHD